MSQVTHDRLHVTRNTWHMTCETWHLVYDKHALKISDLYLFQFGIDSVLKIFELKDRSIN